MGLPVAFVAMPAREARPRRVARIDRDYRDARQLRLVTQEGAKLEERPVRQPGALPSPNSFLAPGSQPFQVFDCDTGPECLGFGNDRFGDSVVHRLLVTRLFAGEFLEPAFGGPGSPSLEGPASFQVSFPVPFHVGTGEAFARRIGGEVDDAEVHPEELGDGRQVRFGNVNRDVQEPLAVAVNKVGLSLGEGELLPLVFTHDKGDDLPAGRADLYGNSVDALVAVVLPVRVGHGGKGAEGRLPGPVPFVGFADLSDDPDSHVGGDAVFSPQVFVNELLQPELVGGLLPERDFGDGIAGGIEPPHRIAESVGLFSRREQTQLHGDVHGCSIGDETTNINLGRAAIPPSR